MSDEPTNTDPAPEVTPQQSPPAVSAPQPQPQGDERVSLAKYLGLKGTMKTLQNSLEREQEAANDFKAKHTTAAEKIETMEKSFAHERVSWSMTDKLREAGAINPTQAMQLISLDDLKVEDGKPTNTEEIIEKFKTENDYMFGKATPKMGATQTPRPAQTGTAMPDFASMSRTEHRAWFASASPDMKKEGMAALTRMVGGH